MQFEIFPIAEYTTLYYLPTSTKTKRPQAKPQNIPQIQEPEDIGAIAKVGDRIDMCNHIWEVVEECPNFFVMQSGTTKKHIYRHEMTSRKAYQVRFVSRAHTTKRKGDRPSTKETDRPSNAQN